MMTDASQLYPIIAEKYNLSIEDIRNIVIYFWRSGVKRSLEGMVNKEIYVNKLGSFEIKDWKLKYAIPTSYLISQRTDIHEKNVEYFTTLNTQLKVIDEEFKNLKIRKKEFDESNKQTSRDIQESQTDMGRSQEQTN